MKSAGLYPVKINTINNWAEVNYLVYVVPSTKRRMIFNFKYAVKHYNYFPKQNIRTYNQIQWNYILTQQGGILLDLS